MLAPARGKGADCFVAKWVALFVAALNLKHRRQSLSKATSAIWLKCSNKFASFRHSLVVTLLLRHKMKEPQYT